MKKLAVILFALSFAACSGDDKEAATPKCNQECGGALANNPNSRCDLYAPDLYESGSVTCVANDAGQCVVDTTSCVEIPPVPEFGKCSGSGQGDCDEGLECVTVEPGLTACMEACSPTDATACSEGDTPRVCVQLTQTSGYCLNHTAKLNEPCFAENRGFNWCEDGQGQCRPTKTNLVGEWQAGRGYESYDDADWRCKAMCDLTEDSPCGGTGEECLEAPTRNIMGIESTNGGLSQSNDGSDYKECDPETTGQCATGFECVKLTFTNGDEKNLCTMFERWCGERAAFCDAFDQSGFQACSQASPCNIAPNYDLCTVEGNDPEVQDASTFCRGAYELNGEPLPGPICIGFCENDDVKNEAGNDLQPLDCGEGYNCAAPDPGKEWSFTHQSVVDGTVDSDGNPDESVTCTENSQCDGDKGFTCIVHPAQDISTKHCFRPTKVCRPITTP